MVADIKVGIELPAGQTQVEWRTHDALVVTRDMRHLGFNKAPARMQGNQAIENADRSDIEWHAFALEMEKERVSGGKPIVFWDVRHGCLRTVSDLERKPRRQLRQFHDFVDIDVDPAQSHLEFLFFRFA